MIVTDETFDEEVLESDIPVLVDFWAGWCAPCKALAPVLESLESQLAGKLKIVKVDADENPDSVVEYGVTSLPTMHIFVNGEIVKTIIGAKAKGALLKELAPVLETE